jgi:glycosyltransferase involved in cell wall biosynthesis
MNYTILISVVICTHNPKLEYLSRVLQALDRQSLSKDRWELILIDNASEKILSQEIDISWHPHSRHVREDRLGVAIARLRGMVEANSEMLLFVDDDNILDPDYLELALQIGKDYPCMGVWGGQLIPEFEIEPPEWTRTYWEYLAIMEFDRDRWSNQISFNLFTPTAGMCLRKIVGDKYIDLVNKNPERMKLGRKGTSLISCEDLDIAFTACDLGLGMGQFTKLKLTHIIRANRLNEDYLLKLIEANGYSEVLLKSFREKIIPPPKLTWKQKILQSYRLSKLQPRERRFYSAQKKGEELALKQLFTN